MTELREIAEIVAVAAQDASAEQGKGAEYYAKQILTLLKENYVRLSDDHSLPKCSLISDNQPATAHHRLGYAEAQDNMLKANFRRVELLEG